MRKLSILQGLAYGFFVLALFSCKKDAEQKSKTAYDSKFSFSFKGHDYTLPLKEGATEWAVLESGIFINRPDIFNGVIYFPKQGCAWLDPEGSSIQKDANCVLTRYGSPIDSSAVYLYSSGNVFLSYSNCSTHSEYDPYTGATIPYDVCDVKGTFDLVLKNTNNDSIVITNGKIEQYNLRR